MKPAYLEYWSLDRPPFSLTPDPEMLYLSNQHQECLMRLKFAILSDKGGALVVSDDAGAGKTSVLNKLSSELRSDETGEYRVIFIDHPTMTASQMIREIARQTGVEKPSRDKITNLNRIKERLTALRSEGGRCVLIIDEGQMLADRPDILQELRILLNLCLPEAFLLTFILSGQKPIEKAIRKMPEFWQRLPVRFFLGNLDLSDTGRLIQHRLRMAGHPDGAIFADDGYKGIHRFSQGCPRVICSVADLALVIGHSVRASRIGFGEVSRACADMTQSGDAFHYFDFLQSFDEQEAAGPTSPTKIHLEKNEVEALIGDWPFIPSERGQVQRKNGPRPNGSPRTEVPAAADSIPDTDSGSIDASSGHNGQGLGTPPGGGQDTCPECGAKAAPDQTLCQACGTDLYTLCMSCVRPVPLSTESCPWCSTGLTPSQTDAERDFIQGLKILRLDGNGLNRERILRRCTLAPNERPLFVLPTKGLFRSSARFRMRIRREQPAAGRCGLVVSSDALNLLTKDGVVRIARDEVTGTRVEKEKQGDRIVDWRTMIKIANGYFVLSFPFPLEKRQAFARLLSKYLQGADL